MSSLAGQVAVLTGGSTELAQVIAAQLCASGVNVCLCGKSAQLVEEAAARISTGAGRCIPALSMLSELDEAEKLVEDALSAFGRLDLLVTVSPFFAGGHIHSHNVRTWDTVLNANLREAFLINRAVLPVFRTQRSGQTLAVSSDSGLGSYDQDGAYGVAMHALNAMMQQIQVENAEMGIRAHVLCPGLALAQAPWKEASSLSPADVADWVIWLLTRPDHLRSNGPILV